MGRRRTPRPRAAAVVATVSWAAFVVLTLAVALRFTRPLDEAVRRWARPHDVWQSGQMRADMIVETFRPIMVVWVPAVTAVVMCAVRRSVRPALLGLGVGAVGTGAVLGAKVLLARPDPHATSGSHGGSYPSGHTVTVILGLGLALFLVAPRPRRGSWLIPALAGGVMGGSLIVEAAHWATDVLGGALLATALLATIAAGRWPHWAAEAPPQGRPDPRWPGRWRPGRWRSGPLSRRRPAGAGRSDRG